MDERRYGIDWGEAIVPGIALAFGLAFFLQTRNAPAAAMYWPIIAASLSGIILVLIVFRFVLVKKKAPASFKSRGLTAMAGGARRSGLIFLGATVYLAFLPYLGFSVCSSLFMLAVFRGMGSRQWLRNVVIAVSLTAFLHLILIVLMKMSLPRLTIGQLTL